MGLRPYQRAAPFVKLCSKCRELKPSTEFYNSKENRDGLRSQCKCCISKRWSVYVSNNKEKVRSIRKVSYEKMMKNSPERVYAYQKKFANNNPESHLICRTRARARRCGVPFNITKNDINIPNVCPILGMTLERGNKQGGLRSSPSIDRVVPEIGYVKGNVQIVSSLANRMKSDATPQELLRFAEWVYNTYA